MTSVRCGRRRFIHLVAGAAALPTISRIAWAQAYPTRPVRLIAPAPAGGNTDLYARLIAQLLSQRLGQSFFVENRPGAGANIGTEAAVRAAPDGYTLLQVSSQNAWAVGLYDKLNFDLLRDLSPVASIYRAPGVLVVHPSFPAKSVPELIAYAKANPGKINMASGGIASTAHVYGEMFKMMASLDMLHVPYRGGGPAMADLLAGHVPLMIDSIGTSIEYIKGSKLRALAVTSLTRSEMMPDLPTIAEFVPGYEGIGWQGVAAPRNTPPEIIERLSREINAGLDDPPIKARIADLGASVFRSSPAEFGAFIAAYTEKWAKVIRAANIKPE
jgi:tripartite-type tricarboxylate transporter receptor subunit TctC